MRTDGGDGGEYPQGLNRSLYSSERPSVGRANSTGMPAEVAGKRESADSATTPGSAANQERVAQIFNQLDKLSLGSGVCVLFAGVCLVRALADCNACVLFRTRNRGL